MNVLVVAAHPDDEILGIGGTLLKHVDEGDSIYVLLLTDGHSARGTKKDKKFLVEIKKREKAAHTVCKFFGFTELVFGDFQDQKLDTVPLVDIIQLIEKYAEKVKPDIVYTHHRGDLNKDHRITFEAVVTAFRYTPELKPRKICCFETVSSTEWAPAYPDAFFIPNYFVNISKYLDKKLESLKIYEKELREYPHPRSIKGIEISARRWGTVVGFEAAEAFYLVKELVF